MPDFFFVTGAEFSPETVGRQKSVAWSCSKTARPNDRAFVYVTGQGVSFEWIIYGPPRRDADWGFQCPVRLLAPLTPPIAIQELRNMIPRRVWAPPHTGLRGYRSIRLPPKAAAIIRSLRSRSSTSLEAIDDAFAKAVTDSRARTSAWRRMRLARAARKPQTLSLTVTAFLRNPDVAAEVLERADGKCESCKLPAPFRRASDASPYLEVHHVVRLADGGEDTVKNAIALCPNCHRRAHYGVDRRT
jgi:hypothetical protein